MPPAAARASPEDPTRNASPRLITSSDVRRAPDRRGKELTEDQEQHGDRGAGETGQIDPLRAEAAGERGAEQRSGDGREDLRHEQEPVLGVRQVVPVGIGENVLAAGNVTSTIPCTAPAA